MIDFDKLPDDKVFIDSDRTVRWDKEASLSLAVDGVNIKEFLQKADVHVNAALTTLSLGVIQHIIKSDEAFMEQAPEIEKLIREVFNLEKGN